MTTSEARPPAARGALAAHPARAIPAVAAADDLRNARRDVVAARQRSTASEGEWPVCSVLWARRIERRRARNSGVRGIGARAYTTTGARRNGLVPGVRVVG